MGNEALFANTTGSSNTAVGHNALRNSTTNSFNTAVGSFSLNDITNGSPENVAVGWTALGSSLNTRNVAVGNSAGENESGNQNCTYVGYDADASSLSAIVNSTAIGNGSRVTISNEVKVGNTSVTTIGGYADWTTFSDGRYKKNIKEEVPGLKFISMLRPVTYTLDIHDLREYLGEDKVYSEETLRKMKGKGIDLTSQDKPWNKDKEKIVYTGFIAQDVDAAAKKLGYDFSGVQKPQNKDGLYGLRYAQFVVPLVKAVQELNDENGALKNDNAELKSQIGEMKSEMDQLKNIVQALQQNFNTCNPCAVNTTSQLSSKMVLLSNASLQQNIPNPFNHTTTINYTLPQQYSSAKMIVSDKSGKVLREISLSAKGKGSLTVDASMLASGAYQYSLYIDNRLIDTKQMEHIK